MIVPPIETFRPFQRLLNDISPIYRKNPVFLIPRHSLPLRQFTELPDFLTLDSVQGGGFGRVVQRVEDWLQAEAVLDVCGELLV